ncbi:hypothetical protein [Streptomyces sp. NPDC048277]|uniref:hypothetical protein n=1 Tax=Streptomyces sp. NPDC048277 TaxID=3155027 RepID=UPI0033D4C17D
MRAIRVASAALLGLGALALSAPAILANDGGDRGDGSRDSASLGFRVTPSTVAAGGRVSLHLNRGDSCRGAATVTSGLFDTVRIPPGQDSGTATVDRDVRSQASYRVTFSCDGATASTELAVADGGSGGKGDGRTDGRADTRTDGRNDGRTDGRAHDSTADGNSNSNSTHASTDARADGGIGSHQELNPQPLPPNHGVQAGTGGSFGGFDLGEIGLGAALVVGSVGTAYRIVRRHAGGDGA